MGLFIFFWLKHERPYIVKWKPWIIYGLFRASVLLPAAAV